MEEDIAKSMHKESSIFEIFPFDDDIFIPGRIRTIEHHPKKKKCKRSPKIEKVDRKILEEYICKLALARPTDNIVKRHLKCREARDLSKLELDSKNPGKSLG